MNKISIFLSAIAFLITGCATSPIYKDIFKEEISYNSKEFTPTPESPALQSGDEWLSGSEFSDGVRHSVSSSSESSDRPPKERRNSK